MTTAGGGRTSTCTAGTGACEAAPAVGLCMCGRAAPAPQVEVRRDDLSGLSPCSPIYPRLGALVLSGYH
jgi:hypothetical protein